MKGTQNPPTKQTKQSSNLQRGKNPSKTQGEEIPRENLIIAQEPHPNAALNVRQEATRQDSPSNRIQHPLIGKSLVGREISQSTPKNNTPQGTNELEKEILQFMEENLEANQNPSEWQMVKPQGKTT